MFLVSQENLSSLTTECEELKKTLREVEQSRMEHKRDSQLTYRQLMAFKHDLLVKEEEVSNQKELQKQSEQREMELLQLTTSIKQKVSFFKFFFPNCSMGNTCFFV